MNKNQDVIIKVILVTGLDTDNLREQISVDLTNVIIYIQKFLQSDWWRASQFILNVVQKCEIECRKLKLVQKR